jgi:hypothetical protein
MTEVTMRIVEVKTMPMMTVAVVAIVMRAREKRVAYIREKRVVSVKESIGLMMVIGMLGGAAVNA